MWWTLPPDIRLELDRRERDRDREVRRAQNELAALRKKYEPKTTEEKPNGHAGSENQIAAQ